MTAFKILTSKNYWKYIFSYKKLITDILSVFGTLWLLVEMTSFFSLVLATEFKNNAYLFITVGFIWVIYSNWPKTSFCYFLKDRDIRIQISIGDIFSFPGDVVIPLNTSFDTSFEGGLIYRNSVQGQFTSKFFKEPRFLDQDIKTALSGTAPISDLPNKLLGNKYRYSIGEIVKVNVPNHDKAAYLSAITDMSDQGVASTSFDNILTSLGKLWDFMATDGGCGEISIPLLGTDRGRIPETRETVIKAIIHSFTSSISSRNRFCNKLNIVIYPRDFKTHAININELKEYLRLMCIHHHQYQAKIPISNVGTGIT